MKDTSTKKDNDITTPMYAHVLGMADIITKLKYIESGEAKNLFELHSSSQELATLILIELGFQVDGINSLHSQLYQYNEKVKGSISVPFPPLPFDNKNNYMLVKDAVVRAIGGYERDTGDLFNALVKPLNNIDFDLFLSIYLAAYWDVVQQVNAHIYQFSSDQTDVSLELAGLLDLSGNADNRVLNNKVNPLNSNYDLQNNTGFKARILKHKELDEISLIIVRRSNDAVINDDLLSTLGEYEYFRNKYANAKVNIYIVTSNVVLDGGEDEPFSVHEVTAGNSGGKVFKKIDSFSAKCAGLLKYSSLDSDHKIVNMIEQSVSPYLIDAVKGGV
ncbi:hypothetical protein HC723_11655 [Vibrio sp. S11_S32]|uniref:hypothetical protein n=1 Tax=Vibrio sp. S11_S32 TaxID=2720225 RepID=UPI0016816387|nr:hypothetical protein [Vibrio sp. S11_S32]MBD1577087.1 hypothetical protein [Vibrio sp. S11_S32]